MHFMLRTSDGKWGKLNKEAQGENITLHEYMRLLMHTDTSLKSFMSNRKQCGSLEGAHKSAV